MGGLRVWGMLLALSLALSACHGARRRPEPAVNIADGDTCAVCGMYIKGYPGPRAEAYLDGVAKPLKFGSTRDFFAYVTRADVAGRLGAVYVQDVSRIRWAHPSNRAASFIDARKAWYVAEQARRGAMGPTLAAFGRKAAAQRFAHRYGGVVLRYAAVTPVLISRLSTRCPPSGAGAPFRGHCLAPDRVAGR